ncbi:hypothetical protein PspLS_01631 [Pyricularia sp. CBS 133598]|nr:hypothetical protein PspLS_01631 [Pyricularia sp. CBS 133598]
MGISRHGSESGSFPYLPPRVLPTTRIIRVCVAKKQGCSSEMSTRSTQHPGTPRSKVSGGAESRPPVVGQSTAGLWNHSDDCREKRNMGQTIL